jgi:poly(A) polymerase
MHENPQARLIVETLSKAGFIAYYAGGWVRDYILKHESDDIDIATNAPPETIQALFPHTVPVGIAFGIVVVIIDGHQFEVATFRQDIDYKDGRRPTKIEYCSPVEDAKRRDFTINGMFFDPLNQQILDYVEGQKDLKAKVIRAIGNPHQRIKEDRLRMIRAIRMSCRFGFTIEHETKKAILAHAKELLPAVAIERVWQELTKGHSSKKLYEMLTSLFEYHLLQVIFPDLKQIDSNELHLRLHPTLSYPNEAPLIAHIIALFPSDTLEDDLNLCKRLKLSNCDMDFIKLLFDLKSLYKNKNAQDSHWAKFYAEKNADLVLEIFFNHINKENPNFLLDHQKKKQDLKKQIQRIREKKPVLTSKHLIDANISPGKLMGDLLKEGENISINEKIEDPNLLIQKLKKTTLWPKE